MKRKKIAAVCMLILLTSAFQGCSSVKDKISDLKKNAKDEISDFKKNVKEYKNAEYRSAQREAEFLVDAIERKDAQAIKDKFSPYAKKNIDNLDEKINRLIDEFPGWNGDYEITDTCERWSNHGKITYMLTPHFDFNANGTEYRMRIIYYTESDEDKSKLGYYSIQIIERNNNEYSSDCYMHGVDDELDILLWDYTKD